MNQMATEASAVSLDNEQTFLTPQNGSTTIDRLNQNYFEIIFWHLTPRWKIILMGSDPVKIISSPEIIFAWFDLCMPEVHGPRMKLIIIAGKLFWYVTPPEIT